MINDILRYIKRNKPLYMEKEEGKNSLIYTKYKIDLTLTEPL